VVNVLLALAFVVSVPVTILPLLDITELFNKNLDLVDLVKSLGSFRYSYNN